MTSARVHQNFQSSSISSAQGTARRRAISESLRLTKTGERLHFTMSVLENNFSMGTSNFLHQEAVMRGSR